MLTTELYEEFQRESKPLTDAQHYVCANKQAPKPIENKAMHVGKLGDIPPMFVE